MRIRYSDAKGASGRGRKKLVQRKDQEMSSASQRTNGFANLNLSGLNASSYVSDSYNDTSFLGDERSNGNARKKGAAQGKAMPPQRKGRNNAGGKGESGLTPAVGGIHLGHMSNLSPGFLSPSFLYGQTPNGMFNSLRRAVLFCGQAACLTGPALCFRDGRTASRITLTMQ
jgi:hypothetical protein